MIEARELSPEVAGVWTGTSEREAFRYYVCGLNSSSPALNRMVRVEDPNKPLPKVAGFILDSGQIVFTNEGNHWQLEFSHPVAPRFKNVVGYFAAAKKLRDPQSSEVTIVSNSKDVIEKAVGFVSRSLSPDTHADVATFCMPLTQ